MASRSPASQDTGGASGDSSATLIVHGSRFRDQRISINNMTVRGATGYLGTVIATAETWRLQVCGSKGWMEVGDVQHLTTWTLRTCFFDPADPYVHPKPQLVTFPDTSTERAELENFADAVREKRPLAMAGGDEEHNVSVLEAILDSAAKGTTVRVV